MFSGCKVDGFGVQFPKVEGPVLQITQPSDWTRPRNQAAGYQRPEPTDAVSDRTSFMSTNPTAKPTTAIIASTTRRTHHEDDDCYFRATTATIEAARPPLPR